MRHLRRLLASFALLLFSGGAHAYIFATIQDGYWYCDPINGPSSCAFGMYDPAPGDTALIQHRVTLDQQGAPYTIPTVTEVAAVNLVSGGELDISFDREVWTSGASTWTGGAVTGGKFRNLGTLEVAGPALIDYGNFDNVGHLTIDSGVMLTRYSSAQIASNSGSLSQPPAVLELQGSAVYADQFGVLNAGHVLKTGSGVAIFSASLTDFAAYDGGGPIGLIEVDAGELQFTPVVYDQFGNKPSYVGTYGANTYQVAAGAVVRFGDSSRSAFAIDGSHPLTSTGSGGGTVIFDDGAEAQAGGGGFDNAILAFPPGMFQWKGGYLGSDGWRNNGEITLTGAGQKILGGRMRNAGNLNVPAGEVLDLNSLLINLPGGTITLDDNSAINDNFNGYIVNEGLIVKNQGTGTALLRNTNSSGDSTNGFNTGTLSVQSGTIEDRTNYAFYGTASVAAGSTWLRTADNAGTPNALPLNGNALISGNGLVSAQYVAAYDNSAIEPGGAGTIGALTLDADLSLNSGAVVFDISGAAAGQYDFLQVGGNLDAGGIFAPHGSVVARFAFAPVMGQRFALIHVGGAVTDPLSELRVAFLNLAAGFQAHLEFNAATNNIELVADSTGNFLPDPIFHGNFE